AATNKDLAGEVERGAFRLDLYHRLDVFHLRLPPLRERPEDILPLARHFLERLSLRLRARAAQFAPPTHRMLARYDYPGTVRELETLIERAVILAPSDAIGPECIAISGPRREEAGPPAFFAVDLDEAGRPPTIDQLERAYIARLLDFAQGNRTQVARLL